VGMYQVLRIMALGTIRSTLQQRCLMQIMLGQHLVAMKQTQTELH
jgi:hypothetical protein